MDKLGFALVANSIPESDTMIGGYRIAIECAKRWLEKGHQVTFFTNPLGKAMISRYIPPETVDFVLAPIPLGLGGRAFRSMAAAIPFYSLMAATGTAVALRNRPSSATAIYSVSPFWADVFPGLFLHRRNPRSRWLVALSMFAPPLGKGWQGQEGKSPVGPERRALALSLNQLVAYPLIRRWADGIYVNNELDRARALRDGFAPHRVAVIGMGVDNRLSQQVPEPAEKTYQAVFLGRLHPQKGVLELVDIWRLFVDRHPGARLAIIGNGPLEKALKAKVEQRGLLGQIDLLGFLDGLEKIRVFKASRMVLHPSLYDSGGMAALEAMSCGLPGVSFDLPDLTVYYPQGMLKTPCYDLAAFAANIECLLEDGDLYRRLGGEALAWAQRWDWDVVADMLLGLVEGLFVSRNT